MTEEKSGKMGEQGQPGASERARLVDRGRRGPAWPSSEGRDTGAGGQGEGTQRATCGVGAQVGTTRH